MTSQASRAARPKCAGCGKLPKKGSVYCRPCAKARGRARDRTKLRPQGLRRRYNPRAGEPQPAAPGDQPLRPGDPDFDRVDGAWVYIGNDVDRLEAAAARDVRRGFTELAARRRARVLQLREQALAARGPVVRRPGVRPSGRTPPRRPPKRGPTRRKQQASQQAPGPIRWDLMESLESQRARWKAEGDPFAESDYID